MTFLFLLSAMVVSWPDPILTPGVIDPQVGTSQICHAGYTSKVRHVTEATKREVFRRYGIPQDGAKYEVDHFISLEIGGKNDIANLWPQPWPEARKKDVCETYLHRRVCKGEITLSQAQKIITTDWPSCYEESKRKKNAKHN